MILAVIYYFGFRFVIRKFNLKTPGREDESAEEDSGEQGAKVKQDELPYNILAALGGKDNIVHLDACITRLRVEVKEKSEVNKDRLKNLGASGVLEVGNNVQAIFGTRSDTIKTQIGDIMSGKTPAILPAVTSEKPAEVEQQAAEDGKAIIEEDIVMPASGELMDITEVPDPVFSEKMTGDGFAVLPHEGTICSPVYGKVFNVFPSKHAIGILSDGGKEVLVHIGVNTVKLKGQGFKVLVEEGDLVAAGQPILEVDIAYVKENAKSLISPVIFSNLPEGSVVELNKTGTVKAGTGKIITIK
ncbi:PTS system glucose-specific EIICBA component [compost metagenome]